MEDKTRPKADFRLTYTYLLALSGIALISILAAVMFWRALGQHTADARLLNLAGRQRMLSQRISKVALELRSPANPDESTRLHRELAKAISDWSEAHEALLRGEAARDLVHVDAATGVIDNQTRGTRLSAKPLPPFLLAMIHDGGLVPHLEKRFAQGRGVLQQS